MGALEKKRGNPGEKVGSIPAALLSPPFVSPREDGRAQACFLNTDW